MIAWIMDADYLEGTAGDIKLFRKEDNLVYSGGGHTVLEFPTREQVAAFTRVITMAVRREYFDIEIFAKTIAYDGAKTLAENWKVTKVLERKKSERRVAFHQGSFGVEQIGTNTMKPIRYQAEEDKLPEKERLIDENLMPSGYHNVYKFEELGARTNRVDKRSYAACAGVAVVHQKYPFYKAYELAEMLCGSAKNMVRPKAATEPAEVYRLLIGMWSSGK